MTKNTEIQWCDSTVNPTMGCDGCELWSPQKKTCYAGILHMRFGGVTKGYAPSFEAVTPFPGRMAQAARWPALTGTNRPKKPWLNSMPRTIFVSDMSDSLSKSVSFEYLEAEIISNVSDAYGQNHQWLWLTKRPQRMAQLSKWLAQRGIDWPVNLWAGTSITDRKSLNRIDHLLRVGNRNTLHFLSVEPAIEDLDLTKWLPKIDWVIHGGESGHGSRCFEIGWAQNLIAQCRKANVPYFLKQLGAVVTKRGTPIKFIDAHAGDWNEWPENIRVRQMPLPRFNSEQSSDETSASVYLDFILSELQRCDGVIEVERLTRMIYCVFGDKMTTADHQSLKGRKMPKWRNMIDWAKAVGASQGLISTVKHETRRYTVLLDPKITSKEWLDRAEEQKSARQKGFRKRCPNCRTYEALSAPICTFCGEDLPISKKRRVLVK